MLVYRLMPLDFVMVLATLNPRREEKVL